MKLRMCFKILYLQVCFLKTFHFKVFFFGVLVFIFGLIIIPTCLFVLIESGVLVNFLLVVFKSYIRIFLPLRIVEGCGECGCWLFILVHINLFICLFYYILQIIYTSLLLLILTCAYCIKFIIIH